MADPFFRPQELQLSKLRPYSIGYVAENKALSSDVIEVTPVEELTMIDGEISAQPQYLKASGVNGDGAKYNSTVATSNALQAKWLKLSSSNRFTAPDVRRGAVVMIYQFGDADKYYWTTLTDDRNLRKLETVVWGISATTDESAKLTHDNTYYFEISSHTKTVTFHTSQANGEAFGYDIQIDAVKGFVVITDTAGNQFLLDSAATRLQMKNSVGSYVDITKDVCSIFTSNQINMKTSHVKIDADDMVTNLTTNTINATNNTLNSTKNVLVTDENTITATDMKVTSATIDTIGESSFEGPAFLVTSAIISLG